MTQEELDKIVEQHMHWLKEDFEGWGDMKANLRGDDLRGADLREADKFRLGKVLDEPITSYKKTQLGGVQMSELVRWQDKDLNEYYNADCVDEVIAEKDNEIEELKQKLLEAKK